MRYPDSMIKEVSYLMASAYDKHNNYEDACNEVEEQAPDFDKMVIFAMWQAIDATEDMR